MYTDKAALIADLYVDYRYEQIRIKCQNKLDHIARQKEERKKKKHMVLYSIICAIFIVVCFTFIHYEIKIQKDINRISFLQAKITSVLETNVDTQKRLQQNTNFNQLQQTAMSYGMHYPQSGEIVYYAPEDEDYMFQISNIPK